MSDAELKSSTDSSFTDVPKSRLYASFSLRFGILFLDSYGLLFVTGGIAYLVSLLNGILDGVIILLGLGFFVFNRVYLLGARGYTVASKLNGVLFLNKNLQPIGVGLALARELLKWISTIPLYFGFFWMLWDKERQTWHDKIVGSRVYYEEAVQHLLKARGEVIRIKHDRIWSFFAKVQHLLKRLRSLP